MDTQTSDSVTLPYAIEEIAAKKVVINKDTNRWDLSQDNYTAINNSPRGHIGKDTVITVTAILYHNIGYSYYLEDSDIPEGYNVSDCDTFKAPPLAPAPPPKVRALPYGALKVPVKAREYYISKTLDAYPAYTMAAQRRNPIARVLRDRYYVFKECNGMLNVTKTPGIAGFWINPQDNH